MVYTFVHSYFPLIVHFYFIIYTAFKEKPKPHENSSNLINAGIYIFEKQLLEYIPSGRAVSIERETYPLLLQKGFKIAVYNQCSYWIDLGTPEKYLKVHKDILKGIIRFVDHDFNNNQQYISKSAKINQNVKVVGPVYIGENVEIESFAVIGPGTVLCDNSSVGKNAKVLGSVVWDNVHVGDGASIVNSVVMSNCKIDKNSKEYNSVLTGDFSHPIAV